MRTLLLGCLLLVISTPSPADDGPVALKGAEVGLGRLIRDVAFTDLDGRAGKFSDYASSAALVVAFNMPGCPLSKKYSATLNALAKEYAKRNVIFLLANVDKTATPDELKDWVRDRQYESRYLPNPTLDAVKALYGTTSTEVFVLDRARTLIYRGAIDDQYGLTYSLPQPRRTYLRDALEAHLVGRPIAAAALSAPGCLVKVTHDDPDTQEPTFHGWVSRLLQRNCQSCHRPGENGPFPLIAYRDAVKHAAMMGLLVDNKRMPPWFANPTVGHWANDPALSDPDREALLKWLRGSQAEGNPAEAPLPIHWTPGWKMGPPDAEITVPRPLKVAATGIMPYQYVVVPKYDFNWQLVYELRRPLDVPAGTKIRATAWYDNSAANPANPDPSKVVGYGEQTHDEMMIGYFNWHELWVRVREAWWLRYRAGR